MREHFDVEEVRSSGSTPPARTASASSATSTPTTARASASVSRTPRRSSGRSPDRSEAYRALDAAILETLILRGRARHERRGHRGEARDRLHRLGRGGDRVARRRRTRRGLPAAPHPGRAGPRAVAAAGETMPPKSTYFFPKLLDRDRLQPAQLDGALGSAPWSASTPRRATTARPRSGTAAGSPKSDPRTEAYGARRRGRLARSASPAPSAATPTPSSPATSLRLQDDLFIAGAELATAPEAAERLEDGVSRVTDEMADELEAAIDRYMDRVDLPPKFVIPGGTAALGAARRRPRGHPPRRAARRRARTRPASSPRTRCCASSTAPPTPPTRWRASPTTTIPSCSPGDDREGPTMAKVVARRREGYTHDVEIEGGHTLVLRRARPRPGGNDEGPSPTRTVAAGARRLHRDHRRDVRGAQGLGARSTSRSRSRSSTATTARSLTSRSTLRVPAARRRAAASACCVIAGKCPVHRALASETPVDDHRPDRVSGARGHGPRAGGQGVRRHRRQPRDRPRDGPACCAPRAPRVLLSPAAPSASPRPPSECRRPAARPAPASSSHST